MGHQRIGKLSFGYQMHGARRDPGSRRASLTRIRRGHEVWEPRQKESGLGSPRETTEGPQIPPNGTGHGLSGGHQGRFAEGKRSFLELF